jgi:hypothetical protein
MAEPNPNPRRSLATPAAIVIAGALIASGLAVGLRSGNSAPAKDAPASAAPSLGIASCSGEVAKSPDEDPFVIALDHCDKAIDAIDVKAGFLTKWTICGGAKSFDISLAPRQVTVTSDAINCASIPSQVSVTYVGPVKK